MMTRNEVFSICKEVAGKYSFDPVLILAMCEQESSYNESEARLEQEFYRRYVRPQQFATSVEVLFSASYGLMQCMGWTLHEMNYFDPVTNKEVAHQLDQFMVQPRLQVEYGCRWLKHKQSLGGTVASVEKALERYNGSDKYPPLIAARHLKLKQFYT